MNKIKYIVVGIRSLIDGFIERISWKPLFYYVIDQNSIGEIVIKTQNEIAVIKIGGRKHITVKVQIFKNFENIDEIDEEDNELVREAILQRDWFKIFS